MENVNENIDIQKEEFYLDILIQLKMPDKITTERIKNSILTKMCQHQSEPQSDVQVLSEYENQYRFINSTFRVRFKEMSELYKKYVINM